MTWVNMDVSPMVYDFLTDIADKHGITTREALDHMFQQWAYDRAVQNTKELREKQEDESLAGRVKRLEQLFEKQQDDLNELWRRS